MRVIGSPINEPRYLMIDQRDWDAIRDRLLILEESNRSMAAQLAFFMQGTKERFDAHGVLLSRFEAQMDRKDLG